MLLLIVLHILPFNINAVSADGNFSRDILEDIGF